MKRITVIFTIACVIATLDYFGGKYDLEQGEPGYETYGGIGAACGLLTLPVILTRYFVWDAISKVLPHFEDWVWSDGNYMAIWITDLMLVFGLAGIFYGLRRLYRRMRKTLPEIVQVNFKLGHHPRKR